MRNEFAPVDTRYCSALAGLFRPKVAREIATAGRSRTLGRVISQSGFSSSLKTGASLADLFDTVYDFLCGSYRCEYVYKNTIANKILLGRHSLRTSTMLTEFRVGRSKVDLVILNGTSNAYEIKSELDTLDRLEVQTSEYLQVFDRVYVVTCGPRVGEVQSLVRQNVGILELTPRRTLRTVREAQSGKTSVLPGVLMDSLRRTEYVEVVKRVCGQVPDLPNTRMYSACKDIFERIAPEQAHDEMVRVLRHRRSGTATVEFVASLPVSLKAVGIQAGLSVPLQAVLLGRLGRAAVSL